MRQFNFVKFAVEYKNNSDVYNYHPSQNVVRSPPMKDTRPALLKFKILNPVVHFFSGPILREAFIIPPPCLNPRYSNLHED
jgi:hypothetical protein